MADEKPRTIDDRPDDEIARTLDEYPNDLHNDPDDMPAPTAPGRGRVDLMAGGEVPAPAA